MGSRAVDRWFHRAKYDAERVVGAFASRLRDEVDPDRLTEDWAAVVSRTLQPVSVAVWVRRWRVSSLARQGQTNSTPPVLMRSWTSDSSSPE